ncbi:MAG: GNAT family N-acetyltransferase [Bacteroidota bacterium]
MAGYLAPTYAASLAHVGQPVHLEESDAWAIARPIAGSGQLDLVGCYPLMACRHWEHIVADLHALAPQYVSFTMVSDPLGAYSQDMLAAAFPDLCRPFKKHFLVDLQGDYAAHFSSNHVRNARKAHKALVIQRVAHPGETLDDWSRLYQHLIKRHAIRGAAAFSREAFVMQLKTPGIVVYKAAMDEETVGMVLFYEMGGHVYYHLAAYTGAGYTNKASFGIFQQAFADFSAAGLSVVNLGGGAGLEENADDGLTRFKRGWASTTAPAYLCGRILDHEAYQKLLAEMPAGQDNFFPAYRVNY